MKTLALSVSLALAAVVPAQAQIFRSPVGGGAALGAVAGGLIGGHNGDRWAEGMVIGAAAGALLGAAIGPQQPVYSAPPVYQSQAPVVYGQQVYGQPAPSVPQVWTVPDASTVPVAPSVGASIPTQVVTAPPQVVYVESAPRVVYVPAPGPRVVYVEPQPVIRFGVGFYSGGPRYIESYRGGQSHYRGHGHHGGHGRGHRR